MPSDQKVLQLISELTRRTIDESLSWRVTDAPDSLVDGTDHKVPLFFTSKLKEQRVGLGQLRYLNYSGELDRFMWNEKILMIFLDTQSRVIWEHSEYSSALLNLFEVVRESVANIDGLIDGLLD